MVQASGHACVIAFYGRHVMEGQVGVDVLVFWLFQARQVLEREFNNVLALGTDRRLEEVTPPSLSLSFLPFLNPATSFLCISFVFVCVYNV